MALLALSVCTSGCRSFNKEHLSKEEKIKQALAELNDDSCWDRPHSPIICQDIEILVEANVREVIPVLIERLNHSQRNIRIYAIWGLGRLGAKDVIPKIENLLSDKDSGVRVEAIVSLWRLNSQQSTPKIAELLHDEEETVRIKAVEILTKMKAKELIPELVKNLKHPNKYVRESAVLALGELQVKEAIPEILPLLYDKYQIVRDAVAETLRKFGVLDKEIKVVPAPENKDPKYRIAIDVFMLIFSDPKQTEFYFEYIPSDTWVEKISIFQSRIKFGDIKGMSYQVLPGVKWFWGHNAPESWYLYAEAGSTMGHIYTEHLGKSDRLNVFTYGYGIGYAFGENGTGTVSFGLLDGTKGDEIKTSEGESLFGPAKGTLILTAGILF
ncbi:MAG: HEAT repeat domain-containing protein [Planctomycetes bacterium]|nr:HEAT repeat domain-containing protein [Planctomycetota bacterium]